jgi:hypothetical protein
MKEKKDEERKGFYAESTERTEFAEKTVLKMRE